MKKFFVMAMVFLVAMTMTGVDAFAGAKVKIDEESNIDFGFRVQTLYLSSEDQSGNSYDDFKLRRGRFRLGGNITDKVGFFLQTDVRNNDIVLIDGFIKLKPHKLAQFIVGQNMAPVLRQNVTSSGGLMTLDRAAITYKNLTWGGRAKTTFTNVTTVGTNVGFFNEASNTVRDFGATLFGSDSISDTMHFKYYLGIYDGIQTVAGEDNPRVAGRVQFNLFDAEAGYYGLSTYLDKKKTIAIGAAFDSQKAVANDGTKDVDYAMFTIDVFADYPLGNGSATFEAAYVSLDLDDAGVLGTLKNPGVSGEQSQGNGYYAQFGYYVNRWQPWVEYENWSSDAAAGAGSFDSLRVGLNYYIKGHNANLKVAYEKTSYDAAGVNDIGAFVVGVYVTY